MTKKTLRGVIPVGYNTLTNVGLPLSPSLRLALDNSNINRNYRVLRFDVLQNMETASGLAGFYNNSTNNNDIVHVTLCTKESATHHPGAFDRNAQIGWFSAHSKSDVTNHRSYVDPNHVIVEDLWIGVYCHDTSDGSTDQTSVPLNYLVEIEDYSTSDEVAIMQLLKENSQNV